MRHCQLCITIFVLAFWPAFSQEQATKRCFDEYIEGGAQAVVFTNDGQYMGSCSLDLFHFYSGGLAPGGFYKFEYYSHAHLAAHPTEPVIAATWQKIALMDMPGKKKIAELKPKNPAWWVAWKSGGAQILSIDMKNTVQVFDVASKKAIQTWNLPLGKKDVLLFAAYSEQSGFLAIATADSVVQVFEAESGKAVGKVAAYPPESDYRITGLSFHPEGKLLATCNNGQIKIWEAATLSMKHEFSARPGGLASHIRYYAKGARLAFANYVDPGYGFTFMDAETGKIIAQGIVAENDIIQSWDMAFPDSPDPEMIVAAGETVYLCRYNVIIGKSPGIKTIK
jgi:WD40 repeat protein